MRKIILSLLTLCCCITIHAINEKDFKVIYDLNVPNDETIKNRQETGTAYVDFYAGKSNIVKNFRNNTNELEKIEKTINDVRKDKDIIIKSISIVGYASPEGLQLHNEQLSVQRTSALADYIRQHTNLPSTILIKTKAGGEDWELLRSAVEDSNLNSKNEILEIIDDSNLGQDAKDKKIQETYPTDYKWLLNNVFPQLRRSVYVIEYTVRNYTDVNEIRRISHSNPQKLSLSEIYRLAKTYKVGSSDFYRTILLGAGAFPHNDIANLNAGAAYIEMHNYPMAVSYLNNAGNSELACYNRGVYYAHVGEYDEAVRYFNRASGIKASAECLRKIQLFEIDQAGNSYVKVNDLADNNTEISEEQKPVVPEYVFKSNLNLGIGYSGNFGEHANLVYYTPSVAKNCLSKFFITSGIGKEFIFSSPYKNHTTWFIGGGYVIGWYVEKRKSHSGGAFYSMSLNYGKSCRYEKNAWTWDAVTLGYIYNRFTFSGSIGASIGKEGINNDYISGFEGKISISCRLF